MRLRGRVAWKLVCVVPRLPLFLRYWPAIVLAGIWAGPINAQTGIPSFTRNASVHDPSVLRDGAQFYVFGSHLASARSTDLMGWTQLSSNPVAGNALAPDPQTTFAEAIAWIGGGLNFWAPDVRRLSDGRYYMYYCLCEGTSPRSALGLAVADAPGGPYTDLGLLLKSGMWGQASPDGTIYDATRHPNAVDPCLFADAEGRLWMVYGSYSGGIFILRLDPATGRPLAGQGYGKKLIGGNHARIEAPYILHHPGSGYYYLFLSYGGLAADGGYQIRVGRSLAPDGPYVDPAGTNLTGVAGAPGTLFDDASIAPHGAKLVGNYRFLSVAGEPRTTSRGYLSPGHNSAWLDPDTGRAYVIFHTRFVGRGEQHEVRVHRLHINDQGWPVIAPHRHAGEPDATFTAGQIPGRFKLVRHGKDISASVRESTVVTLGADGTVAGAATGTWSLLAGGVHGTLTLAGQVFRGPFLRQWDDDNRVWVLGFTGLSASGEAAWLSKVAAPNVAPVLATPAAGTVVLGSAYRLKLVGSDADFGQTLSYTLVSAPVGATLGAATGELVWTPLLAHVGRAHRFVVRVADDGADPLATEVAFDVAVEAVNETRRRDLTFTASASAGLRDAAGAFTGLTARLPATGSAAASPDPLLLLETAGSGALALTSTQADFNGGGGLASSRAVGLALAELGFTGAQDFAVTAVFRTPPTLATVDQIGLFVGADGANLTRAGIIRFGTAPEAYAVHTRLATDTAGRFAGLLTPADGFEVVIQRVAGVWRYFVDGVEWAPRVGGVDSPPVFLDGRSDLHAGVFAITPFNATPKTIRLEALHAIVDFGGPPPSALERWRETYFGLRTDTGAGADGADPDGDGLGNLLEYALGSHPLDPVSAASPVVGLVAGPRLSLSFLRGNDAALLYTVEAASAPGGPYATIWSAPGDDAQAGPVTVVDSEVVGPAGPARRFLRLRVTR